MSVEAFARQWKLNRYTAPFLITVGALASPMFCTDYQDANPLGLEELQQKASPSVVTIDCLGDNRARERTALGIIVSPDGKIATNQVSLQGCAGLAIRLPDGRTFENPGVIVYDTSRDLILIRIRDVAVPAFALADSDAILAGQTVYVMVRPGSFQEARITGFQQVRGHRLVQVSQEISIGSSGGPVLDEHGRVIAIADPLKSLELAYAEKRKVNSADKGLAIPVNDLKDYLSIETDMPFDAFMAQRLQQATQAAGILPPSVVAKVEPAYSEEARKAGLSGTVLISLVVDANGNPQNPKVIKPLGLGLDEKAIEAVKKWKFKPGTKNGTPVATSVKIEMNFRLISKPGNVAPPAQQ